MITEKSSKRFEFLDGLRGIAALGVVFFHFNSSLTDHGIFVLPTFINFICGLGHHGVQIFFVLSGFVIAYSLRHETISSLFSLRFILKRSIRLDPPYWAIIAIPFLQKFLGIYVFEKNDESITTASQIFANLLYLPDILQVPRLLPVAWTLCLEIQFYIVFVLLIHLNQFLMRNFYPEKGIFYYQSIFSYVVFGSLMMISIIQNTPWAILPDIPGLFINHWYSFFIGSLTCWTILKYLHTPWYWINIAIIGCYILFHGSDEAIATMVTALIIYSVGVMENMHRFLSSWLFQYLGKISYSLYLIHWPIGMKIIDFSLRVFGNYFNQAWSVSLLLAVSLILTLLAAQVFYYLIEYPSLYLSRKLKINFSYQKLESGLAIAK